MPSGRTHDSITLWSLPLIAGLTFNCTQSSSLTLTVTGSYLFSGLMFGPDLDIYSRQYLRWGVLRWLWLPYRQAVRHRSLLSHGPMIGTLLRIAYVMLWVALFSMAMVLFGAIVTRLLDMTQQWQVLVQQTFQQSVEWMQRSLQQHPGVWLALFIGLELGALSHSLSDWAVTAYKRLNYNRPRQPKLPPVINPPTATPPSSSEQPPHPVQLPQLPNTVNAFYPPTKPAIAPPPNRVQLPNFKRPRRHE